MAKQIKKEIKRIKKRKKKIIDPVKILPDSSVFVALIDKKDSHHESVKSLFDFINNYKYHLMIYSIVIIETISRLISKGWTVGGAIKSFANVHDLLSKGEVYEGGNITPEEILKRFKNFNRAKIRFLKSGDFMIMSEGILLDALILTTDKQAYKDVKKYYKNIYFVSDKAKKVKSDLPKFIGDFYKLVSTHQ